MNSIRHIFLYILFLVFGTALCAAQTTTPTSDQTDDTARQPDRITNQDPKSYQYPPLAEPSRKPGNSTPTQRQSAQEQRNSTDEVRAESMPASSEFQQFIFQATGKRLPLFGYDLFQSVPTTFAPVDRSPVPVDYQVGPGDELLLRGWGGIDIDYRATVDRNGDIFIPKVGNIQVAGLKYGQLQPFLKANIARVFRNFDLTVAMGQLRSIQIFVVGQARRPGSYTVGSLSTLVNALFASGGPSPRGTLRHIQLKRNSQIITELDLYDLLLNGDKSKDVALNQGDVIFIPPVGDVVAIEGSVNSPAIYELRGKARLRDVVQYAGGLTPTAAGKKALLERVKDRSIKTMAEFMLDDAGLGQELSNGDLITINALSAEFENAITLRGNVATPGRFAWKPGLRIKDLIPSKDALVTRNFWQQQSNLIKKDRQGNTISISTQDQSTNPNVVPMIDEESLSNRELTSREKSEKERPASESPRGEMELTNQIKHIAPEINWDYAAVQRFDREHLTTQLLPFNLGRAIEGSPDNPDNLLLAAGDTITIFSQADIQVPISKQNKFVRLEGEFNTAGVYEVLPGETLRQLLQRVGGFTGQAYLYGAEFTRESTRKAQQDRLDKFVDQLERDVESNASLQSQNVSSTEEAAGLPQKIESQRRFVEKFKKIKATGRVVLELSPTSENIASLPDIVLEDGDRFVVPYKPAVVNVIGAVNNETSLLYQPNRRLSYYLNRAGGGTALADRSHMFVIRADGSLAGASRSSTWFVGSMDDIRLMPGDTIVVPQKLDKASLLKGLKDWSFVVGQLVLGAAALNTLTH